MVSYRLKTLNIHKHNIIIITISSMNTRFKLILIYYEFRFFLERIELLFTYIIIV